MSFRRKLLLWALLVFLPEITAEDDSDVANLEESGAEYLQNVMDKLQQERDEGQSVDIMELTNILNLERVSEAAPDHTASPQTQYTNIINGPTPLPPVIHAEVQPLSPPPPALTADELNAIYKAALTKGSTLPQIQNGQTFLHHPQSTQMQHQAVQPVSQGVAGDGFPGYYYYFYPIKSFAGSGQANQFPTGQQGGLTPPPVNPPPVNMMEANNNKAMEPLFMAVTGFIGMAIMFIVSVLFLPKFGNIRSSDLPELKEAPNELAVFGKLVIESMDGKDCTERMACEVGRFVRNMRMEKFIKVMEIVLPPNMARQVTLIRKATIKKEKCNFIPCRFKTSRPPAKNEIDSKPWKKGPSPHEIWMKHFEKDSLVKKPSKNVWNKKT